MIAVVGEAVDDGGAEPRVGEGLGPASETVVGGDGQTVLLLTLGQNLEQQLGAATGSVVVKLINTTNPHTGPGSQLTDKRGRFSGSHLQSHPAQSVRG
jgi:hypothetical protein